MPKAKSSSRSKVNVTRPTIVSTPQSLSVNSPVGTVSKKHYRKIAIALLIIILALAAWRFRGLVVAGVVDNQPIWRWDFENRLIARDGQAVFDEMVNEAILRNEAAKKGITASKPEIDAKVTEIEKSLAGTISLADALSQQGLTMDEFRRQVGLQIMVEKLTAGSLSVTDEEVTAYIEQNKDFLTATDEAALKAEAKNNLIAEKRSTEFQKIFAELKKNAKVQSFFTLR